MGNGYLTPDTLPTDTICRVLFIPNNREFIANVTGALQELTFAYNFTEFGSLTPQQTADAYTIMFNLFCFNQGACRVIGEIICFGGYTSPDPVRWLPCDGRSLAIADYPDLYAVIGSNFGAVDSSHFNLPDMQGRVPMGQGSGAGLSPRLIGDEPGIETVTLSVGQIPSHSHTDLGHAHSDIPALPNVTTIGAGAPQPTAIPGVGLTGIASANIQATGGGGSHDNIQPSTVINYFIVALS